MYLPVYRERWSLFLDVQKNQDPAWQPQGSSKTMPWKDFRDKSEKIGDEMPTASVNLWAQRLRFDKKAFDEDHKGEEKKLAYNPLTGQMPRALLTDAKR